MLLRLVFIQMFLVLIAISHCNALEKSPVQLNQKDFAHMIVTGFNWTDGLPQEPSDRDYLVILGGRRSYRFEAESFYNPQTDNVTTRSFELFGPFTGKEWLMGISEASTVHFNILLPVGGKYSLRAVVKGEGFVWNIGNKKLSGGSSASAFNEVDFGEVSLAPGMLEVNATIPPEGGIDSFTLQAPDYNPIQPFEGWRFKEPLTAQSMAEVGIALMNFYDRLPIDLNEPARQISVVDAALPNKDVAPSMVTFLGTYTSRAWMRANYKGATVEVPVKAVKSGMFIVRARALGENLSGSINGVKFSVSGKPYLDMIDLGVFRLEAGDNMVRLNLPPMGGLDVLELSSKDVSPSAISALVGVAGPPQRLVTSDEARRFINGIREKYPVRK